MEADFPTTTRCSPAKEPLQILLIDIIDAFLCNSPNTGCINKRLFIASYYLPYNGVTHGAYQRSHDKEP